MVPYISKRVAGLFRDLAKTISLKEVKFQRLPLLFGELFPDSVQEGAGNYLVDNETLTICAEMFVSELLSIIMTSEGQILAAIDGPMVCDLNDP
jgi:hypothetical protein